MPAKEKGKFSVFLKKTDIYSVTIGPTFNGLKKYPTKFGGGLSIMSLIIILGWLAIQFKYIVLFEKPVISSNRQNIDPDNSGTSPLWNINSTQMIAANNIFSLDDSVFPNDTASYLSALYMVTQYDMLTFEPSYSYYNSTPCENVMSINDTRLDYLNGYTCPDVTNINDFLIPIQGSSSFMGLGKMTEAGYNF